MDCLDLLAVQGTLKESSPAQFKSITSSVLRLLYGPTPTSIHDYWKIIALTRWTFVSKVMSLLFYTLSRFVIAFLPRTLEKEMETHSSIIARKIPWTEEPGRLQPMGSQRVGHY